MQDSLADLTLQIKDAIALVCVEKAVFFPEAGALILSDFHFGKASHFRRSGVAVPDLPEEENLFRLDRLVQRLHPRQIVFSGDMFHSRANQSLMRFAAWRKTLPHIDVVLVPGNHDILSKAMYNELGIEKLPGDWMWNSISVCHDPADARPETGQYYLAGHLHPGLRLRGAGGDAMVLPCLLLGKEVGLLPAFGAFTGLSVVKQQEGDRAVLFGEGRMFCFPSGRSPWSHARI